MARKMGENGPKPQIRKINGRFYAYSSTSRMVDGKKKTVNTCLGRWDPETEIIIPKKPHRSKEELEVIHRETEPVPIFSRISSRNYGGVYFLDRLQRKYCIGEDLMRSFGESAKPLMALAFALTLNPGSFSTISDTFNSMYLREYYGIKISVESEGLNEFTRKIGSSRQCIDRFFEYRVGRGDILLAGDKAANGTYVDGTVSYDRRRFVDQGLDIENGNDKIECISDQTVIEGCYFIQFLSNILLSEIKKVLRKTENGSKYTIEGILVTLSTLSLLSHGDSKGLSKVSNDVRSIMELFSMEVPKEPVEGLELMDDLSILSEPVPVGKPFDTDKKIDGELPSE